MMLCTSSLVMSQIPQAFSYQGLVMDTKGETSINKNVRLKITLVDADTHTHEKEIYSEMHDIESNSLGMFNIDVGSGVPLAGAFDTTSSEKKAHYVKVEMDTTGESNYQFQGTVAFGQYE